MAMSATTSTIIAAIVMFIVLISGWFMISGSYKSSATPTDNQQYSQVIPKLGGKRMKRRVKK